MTNNEVLNLVSNQDREIIRNRSKRNDQNECAILFKLSDRAAGDGAGA